MKRLHCFLKVTNKRGENTSLSCRWPCPLPVAVYTVSLSGPLPAGLWHALLLSMYLSQSHALRLEHFNSLHLLFLCHSSFCLPTLLHTLCPPFLTATLCQLVSLCVFHCLSLLWVTWIALLAAMPYGLCKRHHYERHIFVCETLERDTGRAFNHWSWAHGCKLGWATYLFQGATQRLG